MCCTVYSLLIILHCTNLKTKTLYNFNCKNEDKFYISDRLYMGIYSLIIISSSKKKKKYCFVRK